MTETLEKKTSVLKIITTILISFVILYPIVLVSIGYFFVVKGSSSGDWLITRHADPASSPWGFDQADKNWSQLLAHDDFVALSENDKSEIIKTFSDEIWKIAEEQGYDKDEIDNWLKETAQNVQKYPIKEVKLRYNQAAQYRDLSSLPFPKQKRFKMLWRELSKSDAKTWGWVFLFTGLPTLFILYLSIGFGWLIFSRQIPIFAKIIILSLMIVVLFSVWIFKRVSQERIIGPSLSVISLDGHGYVTAQGQWRGVSEKIAFPDNASKIICEQTKGECREFQAYLIDRSLSVDETIWPITKWDDKEIVVEEQSECTTTQIIINYKDEAVTQIRTGKKPRPADCMVGEGKFITELVSGTDIAFGKFDTKGK